MFSSIHFCVIQIIVNIDLSWFLILISEFIEISWLFIYQNL